MMNFKNTLISLVILTFIVQNQSIPDKRQCVDEKCVGVISLGTAMKTYMPNQEGVLAFNVGAEIKIKSKSSDSSLWGVEIDGKDGYAPKMFIQEYKVLHKRGSLVEGVPHIPVPKHSKPKLRSSERPKEELQKVTTTTPLPTDLDKEKVITDAAAKNTVDVNPSQTMKVVDGTEIPEDIAPVKTSTDTIADDEGIVEDIDFETTNKSTSVGNEIGDDDEDEDEYDDEYEDEEEDDEEEFVEDKIAEVVPQKAVPLKAEIVSEAENEVDLKTENPPTEFSPNITQTDNLDNKTDALPDFANSTSNAGGNATDADTARQVVDNALPQQYSVPSVVNTETANEIAIESVSQEVGNQVENSTTGSVQPNTTVESVTESTAEVLIDTASEINLNESITQAVGQDASGSVQSNSIDEKQQASQNLNVFEQKDSSSKIKDEVAVPESTETVSNKTDSSIVSPGAINLDEAKPIEIVVDNSISNSLVTVVVPENPEMTASPVTSEQSQGANGLDVTTQIPTKAESASPVEGVSSITSESLPEAAQSDLPVNKVADSEVPVKSTIDFLTASNLPVEPIEEAKSSTSESLPTVPIKENNSNTSGSPQVTEQNTIDLQTATNLPVAPAEEANSNTSGAPPVTEQNTIDSQTVTEAAAQPEPIKKLDPLPSEPAYTDQQTISEPKIDEMLAVKTDTVQVVDYINEADVVTTSLPPVALNELLKSAETRSLNPDREATLPTINNDLLSENEEITEVPTPTQPASDDQDTVNAVEFDVTTPNPISSVGKTLPPQLGLFQTILGTVKGFLPSQEPAQSTEFDDELDRILFPRKESNDGPKIPLPQEYCERGDHCPQAYHDEVPQREEKDFLTSLSDKVVELFDILACLFITAIATLLFTFGYYCIAQCRKESELIAKLNVVERSLMASHKEASILKHDLGETCDKLASIENNSFGSNDMVIAIKKELEDCEEARIGLEEQVISLEKELENAAEAGLELNKIVSELLNNQSGDESIISSVEELQRQLNEQQHTILEINAILAEKSRENSELQLILAEQNAKFGGEIASLQQDNDELEAEKNALKTKLDEMKTEFELDITKALEGKNAEIKRLQADIVGLRAAYEEEHRKWQTSVAKVEALEDCLKTVKRDPSVKVSQLIDAANVQAELLDTKRQKTSLNEKLETEMDTRKLLEEQVKSFSEEIEKLKHDFNQSEKDKLEAQTRLEVLSNYFKDKENQLQKELSLKEAMWLKQQGETTSTVDRLTNMQDEIQTLKSQNDALRAEIEAQIAAHKAQIGTLENRAHETWLAARQSERKYEEARSDATALRRKLTSLVGGNTHNLAKDNNLDVNLAPTDMNNAPSPVHMESPGSPLLGRLPPFIPPPFMGPPPPHFMGIPPFIPPGEMRPPPMGRLMSPPPPPGAPHLHRYSPIDDDDDDDEIRENSRGHWRDTYSPPRHSYRYSPDRYMYNPELISNYDTETDFSPPPSPRERSHRSGSRSGSYKAYSPPPQSANSQSMDRPKKSSKGQMSSGSEKSYNSWKGKSKGMV